MPANAYARLAFCTPLVAATLAACSLAGSASRQIAPSLAADISTGEVRVLGEDALKIIFVTACREGSGVALDGRAGSAQQCDAAYEKASASRDAANALSSAFQPGGAVSANSLHELRTTLPTVDWTQASTGGSTLTNGKLGLFDVVVTQRGARQLLSFNWSGPASPIPVDVAGALSMSGRLNLIACHTDDTEAKGRAWHVVPAQGQPFNLIVMSRLGPSGSAISSYSATSPLDTEPMTLASLRAGDPNWRVCG